MLVLALVVLALTLGGEGSKRSASTLPSPSAPKGVVADCSMRSEAAFPEAFTDPRNLVAGPLVLVGGGDATSASVIRGLGGQKFPLLVKAGHTVTVRIPAALRGSAGLAYGPLPQGEIQLRDTHETVTFIACPRDEPSYSYRGHAVGTVTFWSGFVLTRSPACVPLDVYPNGKPSPLRIHLSLGARCKAP
jgi:hypothetical protein